MDTKWKIDYYETTSGKSPAFDFIEGLDSKAKSKVSNTLDLLSEFGIKLGLPHVKRVQSSSLWEIRVLGSDNIRIFYVAKSGKSFLLLHSFIKKKQKTNKKEIKIALQRLKEHNSRVH